MKPTLLTFLAATCLANADEWKPLFNGKDLTGWSGDPRLWSVEDGTIVGITDKADKATKKNTFLILEDMEPGDFDLEFTARVTGKNNSGVQYRSKRPQPEEWVLKGYQFDLHPNQPFLGMLYEEGGRGISCKRGQKVELGEKPKVTGELEIKPTDLAEWNTYRIETRGNVAKHFVNGDLAAEIHDVHPEKQALSGLIGLQLHAGPPMKAEFKDIKIRMMDPSKAEGPATGSKAIDKSDTVTLLPGFKLEQLYQVPKNQGSWVAMTSRGNGVFYCSDQHGGIYRIELKADDSLEVKPAAFQLRGSHGLLWFKDTLWVSVNEDRKSGGVWKVTDSDGDGEPDKPERIKAMSGSGEHGPHSLVPSPDGKWIYFVAGNHTNLPDFDSSLVPKVWQEDQLLTRRPDSRGHASSRMAPGGWIARFRPDDNHWQLFSIGYRNCYDMAFNEHGDAFTYDSDMEWDLGMPWYRPTRICHATPGSEFGWRNGTGKWPEAYEDSMPSQLDIGPGSPTGFISGRNAKFPAKYQRALYAFDWTFATIYAIHLTPDGAGYKAEREELLAGSGLPLTQAVIDSNGDMIFLTGGRRSGSAMWRIRYTGTESTAPVSYGSKELALPSDETAFAQIGSDSRIERHQARVALELEGATAVHHALVSAKKPWATITAAIGLARTGKEPNKADILNSLSKLDWEALDTAQRINWLRAAGLAFIRLGEPTETERSQVLAKIDAHYPAKDDSLNRELCRMLCYLRAPNVVSRTLDLMDAAGPGNPPDWAELAKRNARYGSAVIGMIENLPPAQVIHYIYCLREVKGPWSTGERKRFLAWFPNILNRKGGNSYQGFILDLRKQTAANATPEEQEEIAKIISTTPPINALANLPKPKGPGKAWTADDVERITKAGFAGADKKHGKTMFQAALCSTCHRFGGEGGAAGPDLSTVAGRFSPRDLAEAILEPNNVISDQYAFSRIEKADGSVVIGKVIEKNKKKLTIAFNVFDMSQRMDIPAKDVKDITPSTASPMPAGLINSLNETELRDLLAYMLQP